MRAFYENRELPLGSGVVSGLEILRDARAIVFDVGETLVDESMSR